MAWRGTITNVGSSLLASRGESDTLRISSAAAGAGRVDDMVVMSQTALRDRKQAMSIVDQSRDEAGIKLRLQMTAPDEGYKMGQFGVFARLNGGDEVLLALFQNSAEVEIPSKTDSPDFSATFWALLTFSNTGKLEVTVDANALVTYKGMEAYVERALAAAGMAVTLELTVEPGNWSQGGGGPAVASVAAQGVTKEHVPTVIFHRDCLEAAKTVLPVAETGEGVVKLYAASAPTEKLEATGIFIAGGGGGTPSWTSVPVATPDTVGGVMPGDEFVVDGEGRLSLNKELVLTRDMVAPADEVVREITPLLGGEVQ